jgi:hypothetical protein
VVVRKFVILFIKLKKIYISLLLIEIKQHKKLSIRSERRLFYYDARENRIISHSSLIQNSFWYWYDNYGNRTGRGYYLFGSNIEEGNPIYTYNWSRGSCLESIKTGDNTSTLASYEYDRNGARFRKVTGGVTTNYYLDGHKILGEDKSDGKKLRYFYDMEGVVGFRYYNGSSWKVYTYVKDAMGSIVMIKDEEGYPIIRYTYDNYGVATMVGLDTRICRLIQ